MVRISPSDVDMLRRRQQTRAAAPQTEWLPGRRGFRIFVPGRLVNPLGEVKHRMAEHKRREQWKNGVAQALLSIGYRRGDFDPRAPKLVTMTLSVYRRFDTINLQGAVLKPLYDAIVQYGICHDDRDSSGHQFPIPEQKIDRARPGVLIEVQLL